jgi:hypothetical protein
MWMVVIRVWLICLSEPLVDALHCFDAIFALTECSESDVSFAAWAEAYARSTNHVGLVEHLVEEFP